MIPNLILLTGEDTFRLHERLRVLRKGFQGKYPNGEIKVFETPVKGSGHDNRSALAELDGLVCTPNLFGEKRLAICEADWWNADKFDNADNFWKHLPDNADNSTVLIVQPKLDKRTKWTKYIMKEAKIEEYAPLDEHSLLRWIETRAENLGSKISRADAKHLINRCGTDLWHISSELDKLSTAAHGEAITVNLLNALTIPHPQLEVWDFLANLSQKNAQGAVDKFRSLLTMGTPIHQIFSMIQREIRVHAQLRAGLDAGLSEHAIAGQTKLHPFVVKKTLSSTKNFTLEEITDLYEQLFDIEKRMKSGGIVVSTSDTRPLEVAIEKFIIKCCT